MSGDTTYQDKINKICSTLMQEAIEPAQNQAAEIVRLAQEEADAILKQAHQDVESLKKSVAKEIESKKARLESTLKLAAQKMKEQVRQDFLKSFFHPTLTESLAEVMEGPKIFAHLIESLAAAVEKSGMKSSLQAYIPSCTISVQEVNKHIGRAILEKLKEKSVLVSDRFKGGVQLKIIDGGLTLDFTDEALSSALSSYVYPEFRELFFGKD